MKNSDFDLDLTVGQEAENYVAKVLQIDTIEVKRDLLWFKTSNLYIEAACYSQAKGEYVQSGLRVTKASHWAFVLGDTFIVVPTNNLRNLIDNQILAGTARPVSCDIQPNPSRGYLIRIEDLLEYQRYWGSDISDE